MSGELTKELAEHDWQLACDEGDEGQVFYYILTENDPSVGIFGEEMSPNFETVKELKDWWVKNKEVVLVKYFGKDLGDYDMLIVGKKCPTCDGDLGHLENYEHESGWNVKGFDKKQWLYAKCLRCGYDWALQKLGIPRPNGE